MRSSWKQAHHDLIWARKDWFIAHGLDVADPTRGRWVNASKPGRVWTYGGKALTKFHQSWSKAFDAEWRTFIGREATQAANGIEYTQDEIVAEMNRLILLYPSAGMP